MAELEARELRPGMTIQVEGKLCKVTATEHTGTGKLTHKTRVFLRTILDQKQFDRVFRPDEKFTVVDLERRKLAYSYRDGNQLVFIDNSTYEEYRFPAEQIKDLVPFLKEDTEVEAEFLEGQLVDIIVPETVLVRVSSCAPGVDGIDTNTPKTAVLENGLEILVPQFIEPGDLIRVAVATRKYVERIQNKK